MPSRLGHGLYKKNDCLKNIFCCIWYITTKVPYVLMGTSNLNLVHCHNVIKEGGADSIMLLFG